MIDSHWRRDKLHPKVFAHTKRFWQSRSVFLTICGMSLAIGTGTKNRLSMIVIMISVSIIIIKIALERGARGT